MQTSLVTRSIKENSHRKVAVFLLSSKGLTRLEEFNAARMSAAGEGLTEPILNRRPFPDGDANEPRHPLHKKETTPYVVVFFH